MAPVRSTTRAVTDRRRRLRPLGLPGVVALVVGFAVIAVLVLAFANGRFLSAGPAPPVPPPAAAVGPLLVGDGRAVTLVNLGGSATEAVLARVSADIGQAVTQVEDFWGTDWSGGPAKEITVMATATEVEFSAATAGSREATADIANLAAVTVADEVDPARRHVSGQRIVLAPGASRMSDASLRIVLAHELFHYASRADTAPDAPRWLTEGVADFVARPAADTMAHATAPKQALPTALPSDADFAVAGAPLVHAYDRAWSFARFIADRYGVSGLRALYQKACGVGHRDFAAALQQVIGIGPSPALAGWRDWLAGQR